jgi:hypothetical protein
MRAARIAVSWRAPRPLAVDRASLGRGLAVVEEPGVGKSRLIYDHKPG